MKITDEFNLVKRNPVQMVRIAGIEQEVEVQKPSGAYDMIGGLSDDVDGPMNLLGMELAKHGTIETGEGNQKNIVPDSPTIKDRVVFKGRKTEKDELMVDPQNAFGDSSGEGREKTAAADSWWGATMADEEASMTGEKTDGKEVPKEQIAEQDMQFDKDDIFGEETHKDELKDRYEEQKKTGAHTPNMPVPNQERKKINLHPNQSNTDDLEIKMGPGTQEVWATVQKAMKVINRQNYPGDSYWSHVVCAFRKMGGKVENLTDNDNLVIEKMANIVEYEKKVAQRALPVIHMDNLLEQLALNDSYNADLKRGDKIRTLRFAARLVNQYCGKAGKIAVLKLANKFETEGNIKYSEEIDRIVREEV